ncbi:hypothetical protein EFB08_04005 [Rufibacter latericius]|uniref:Uncharacterized protein n=1 Tax=Rufibacter latericius TaxID=2487040 RepID=A0A3M9MY36_9BACT|nr:hypothetical protein EFB08_04005 [Rufibacter latericius]
MIMEGKVSLIIKATLIIIKLTSRAYHFKLELGGKNSILDEKKTILGKGGNEIWTCNKKAVQQ